MPKGLGLTPKSGVRKRGETSTFAAGMMLLKAYLGSGLLAMPYGLQCGGLWAGIIGLCVLASASNFTLKLFIKLKVACVEDRTRRKGGGGAAYMALGDDDGAAPPSSASDQQLPRGNNARKGASSNTDDAMAERLLREEQQDEEDDVEQQVRVMARASTAEGPVTLMDIGRFAYGHIGQKLMKVVMVVSNVGVAVSYTLFVGDTLADVAGGGHTPADSNGWVVKEGGITINYFTLMLIPPMAALSQLKDMSKLAFTSILGNVALMIVILMVCYLSGGQIQADTSYTFAKPSTFPLFFGITIFSFSMHGVILGIEDGMTHKEQLPRTCNICAVVVTSIYSLFGAVGFAGYRNYVDQSIVSNLKHSIPVQLVEVLLCMSMFLSVPLFAFPVFEVIEAAYIKVGTSAARRARMRLCFRTSLVVFMVGLATLLGPMFADVVSFVGAFSMSFLVFIMPTGFFIKVFKKTAPKQELVKAWVVLVFGVVGMATASTVSVIQIIQYFQDPDAGNQCDAPTTLAPTPAPKPAPGLGFSSPGLLGGNLTSPSALVAAAFGLRTFP